MANSEIDEKKLQLTPKADRVNHFKKNVEKDNVVEGNSLTANAEEVTAWAVGTQHIPNNDKSTKPSTNGKLDKTHSVTKRYSQMRRKKDQNAEISTTFSDDELIAPIPLMNQDRLYDFSSTSQIQPTTSAPELDSALAIANPVRSTPQLKPNITKKNLKSTQLPRWITNTPKPTIKFKVLHFNRHKLDDGLHNLMLDKKTMQVEHLPHGIRLHLKENSFAEINFKNHEVTLHHPKEANLSEFSKLLKELGIDEVRVEASNFDNSKEPKPENAEDFPEDYEQREVLGFDC